MTKQLSPKEDRLREAKLIRRGWLALWLALMVTLVFELLYPIHGHFAVEELPGFNALYGFGACVAIIIVSVFLGKFLKRKPGYYEEAD